MKKVVVVILNYNGEKLFPIFLPSVIQYSNNDFTEIIIADNASTDNSVEFLKENYPTIRRIELSENYGFAEGYNQALEILKEENQFDYYILLNSDVEVTENWLTPIIKIFEKDTEKTISAIQPKIRMHAEKHLFEHAGAAGGMIDYLGYPFCRGRIFDTLEEDKGQYDDQTSIFWATGAAMAIRSEVYHDLGGLDKDFFAHMEEIDLCWRIHHTGKKIMYCPESTVFHLGGGTLNPMSERKAYLNFRNGLTLLLKNLPSKNLFFKVFFRMVLDGIAGVKFLLEGKPKFMLAILKAHFYMYSNLSSTLKKRKANQAKFGTLKLPKIVYPKSIVWQYFANKNKTFKELD
ncbi:glycosyltransferase family 2 protein [Bernardetia sp.]|uniref:glycosyltransferase family 2 protein n=1 Tax=Bernardetia sp. TaxID=1937974 RepID=UPI0025BF2BB6|nr:glycosyltransferase family 2 protein [Bernardetia sp.]